MKKDERYRELRDEVDRLKLEVEILKAARPWYPIPYPTWPAYPPWYPWATWETETKILPGTVTYCDSGHHTCTGGSVSNG